MKNFRPMLVFAVAGWLSACFAPVPLTSGPPSKIIECCACVEYRDVQTGCDKHDCPECPIHRNSPGLK
jgi:hypothetical protein